MNVLCAGAAQGLVRALQGVFLEFTGGRVEAHFGAVGALKDALLAGEPCDMMIVTADMVADLQAQGRLVPGSERPLGQVRTGIAVPSEAARPDVSSCEALRASLMTASAVYMPDAQRSTAGRHLACVLRDLGIGERVQPRLRAFPDGATAMRALADDAQPGAIGYTQITEIRYTAGITLAGPLPPAFELATVYSAALASDATNLAHAQRFIDLIAGPRTRVMREQGGFEVCATAPAAAL